MKRLLSLAIVSAALVALVFGLPGHNALHGDQNDAPKESSAMRRRRSP